MLENGDTNDLIKTTFFLYFKEPRPDPYSDYPDPYERYPDPYRDPLLDRRDPYQRDRNFDDRVRDPYRRPPFDDPYRSGTNTQLLTLYYAPAITMAGA